MGDEPQLTCTQELIMEVLAARHRTGEQLWTFSSRSAIRKAANELEDMGLVWLMNGMVERTFRAGLTDKGRNMFVDPLYRPPNADRCCCNHPDVGPSHACARCRVDRHQQCILKEVA